MGSLRSEFPLIGLLLLLLLLLAASGCQRATVPITAVAVTLTGSSNAQSGTGTAGTTTTRGADDPHRFIGRSSCSAAGCHGHNSTAPAGWNNAYQVWDLFDPHRRAFDVLYSELSVEIYLRHEQLTKDKLDDTRYLRFLEQKCIGCHATPPPGTAVKANLVAQTKPDAYWQGVSCESCHGAAGDWYGRHYLNDWRKELTAEQRAGHDFRDLRPLAGRAAVCVQCHVGPQCIGVGKGTVVYDVNHDLIAAGHPRLNFEFNAYLSNLPKHWNETNVWQKQNAPVPADFHFESWRIGQVQKLTQTTGLTAARPQGKWAEFANHDCRECHHAIGEPNFKWNKRKAWTRDQLTTAPATLLQKLIEASQKPIAGEPVPGFDEAVDLYLAASALRQDQVASNPALQQAPSELMKAVDALRAEIEQQHEQQGGKNQYDLIDGFNPQTENFRNAIQSLKDELEKLSQP